MPVARLGSDELALHNRADLSLEEFGSALRKLGRRQHTSEIGWSEMGDADGADSEVSDSLGSSFGSGLPSPIKPDRGSHPWATADSLDLSANRREYRPRQDGQAASRRREYHPRSGLQLPSRPSDMNRKPALGLNLGPVAMWINGVNIQWQFLATDAGTAQSLWQSQYGQSLVTLKSIHMSLRMSIRKSTHRPCRPLSAKPRMGGSLKRISEAKAESKAPKVRPLTAWLGIGHHRGHGLASDITEGMSSAHCIDLPGAFTDPPRREISDGVWHMPQQMSACMCARMS